MSLYDRIVEEYARAPTGVTSKDVAKRQRAMKTRRGVHKAKGPGGSMEGPKARFRRRKRKEKAQKKGFFARLRGK